MSVPVQYSEDCRSTSTPIGGLGLDQSIDDDTITTVSVPVEYSEHFTIDQTNLNTVSIEDLDLSFYFPQEVQNLPVDDDKKDDVVSLDASHYRVSGSVIRYCK